MLPVPTDRMESILTVTDEMQQSSVDNYMVLKANWTPKTSNAITGTHIQRAGDGVWHCVQQWKKSTLVWQHQYGLSIANSSPETVCQLSHATCKCGSWFPLISKILAIMA